MQRWRGSLLAPGPGGGSTGEQVRARDTLEQRGSPAPWPRRGLLVLREAWLSSLANWLGGGWGEGDGKGALESSSAGASLPPLPGLLQGVSVGEAWDTVREELGLGATERVSGGGAQREHPRNAATENTSPQAEAGGGVRANGAQGAAGGPWAYHFPQPEASRGSRLAPRQAAPANNAQALCPRPPISPRPIFCFLPPPLFLPSCKRVLTWVFMFCL